MDDSNPLAYVLELCYGDEDDDDVAFGSLADHLRAAPERPGPFLAALDAVLASGDEREALGAVRNFANRFMAGSGLAALAWLEQLRDRLTRAFTDGAGQRPGAP